MQGEEKVKKCHVHTHTLFKHESGQGRLDENKNVFSRVCSSCFPFFVVSTNQRAHTQRKLQQNTNTRRRGSAGRRNVQTASAELSRLLFHCCIEEMHISVTAIILNESSFKHSFQFHPFMNDLFSFLFFLLVSLSHGGNYTGSQCSRQDTALERRRRGV